MLIEFTNFSAKTLTALNVFIYILLTLVDKKYTFEIGGKNKKRGQIKDVPYSYIIADDIEYGTDRRIPLWLLEIPAKEIKAADEQKSLAAKFFRKYKKYENALEAVEALPKNKRTLLFELLYALSENDGKTKK